jgi:hypothetical protein
MRKKRKIVTRQRLNGKINSKEFIDVDFEELIIHNAKLNNVQFINCKFKNSYIGFNSHYSSCSFIKCKFFGRYSSLGEPTKKLTQYNSCNFINCNIFGMEILNGTIFNKCKISGVLKNTILRDSIGKYKNSGTSFNDSDLEELNFNNISIYGNYLFNNTKLPKNGLVLLDNENDKLIKRANTIIKKNSKQYTVASEILFMPSLHSGQNPIILDEPFLKTFFKTNESRQIFNQIIEGHIINR